MKKTLRVGALARLGTLDPRNTHDTASSLILDEIYETLYAPPLGSEIPEPMLVSEALRPEPGSPDRPVYSVAIRPDVVFSDGTPLTPEIIVKSLSGSSDFTRQAAVEARGNRLVFRLTKPNPRFDLVLTNNYACIVLERAGTLLGTGPFMFPQQMRLADLQRQDRLTLVKNPRHRNAVDIDEIIFATYAASTGGGTEVLLEAAKRGDVDFTYSLTSVDAVALRGFPFLPTISTGNATGLLYFNTSRSPLDDAAVRKAIAYAIDRRKLAESTYERNPLAYVASGLLPPLMGRDRHTFTFDLQKAKTFAAAAGSKMPKRLQLMLIWSPRPYMPNPRRAGELIQEQLAEIGVEVELVTPKDRGDYYERVNRGAYELLLSGWIADTADPADFLEALLASYAIPGPGNNAATTNNLSRWSSPAMDGALARFRALPTDENRAEVMRIVVEESPLVPLIYGQAVAICSRNVSGFQHSVLGRCSLAKLKLRG